MLRCATALCGDMFGVLSPMMSQKGHMNVISGNSQVKAKVHFAADKTVIASAA
jgi:hypothetical protein